jgi:NAD(P)-dependent dehydrogenase (short-subunit alcohol dehydrogenase family)
MAQVPNPDIRFDDRVVIVTGAGGGMGRAHAELLAERGAKVVVNDVAPDSTSEGSTLAEVVAGTICANGGTAVASTDTVATESGAAAIVKTAVDTWGRVDCLVHNAGIAKFAAICDVDYSDYRRMLAVHLDGALLLTRASWPHMRDRGYGRLLYITSSSGSMGQAMLASYAIAKAGLIGLMNTAKLEGQAYGITANALGVAASTRMTQSMFRSDDPNHKAMSQWWNAHLRPDQVSPVVAWLIHETCCANGQILETRGGTVCRVFLGTTLGHTDICLTPESVRDHFDEVIDDTQFQVFPSALEFAQAQIENLVKAGVPRAGGDIPRHAAV